MIKVGDVVMFIDDVMVGTEIEEKHDNIMKEVLRKIAKNHLL